MVSRLRHLNSLNLKFKIYPKYKTKSIPEFQAQQENYKNDENQWNNAITSSPWSRQFNLPTFYYGTIIFNSVDLWFE